MLDHESLLRMAIEESRKARADGHHPFAAILVGPDGAVLLIQHNAVMPQRDMTGHAERVLATRASIAYDPAFLSGCTMYTSAEPCAMCSGALYWSGIGRLVYGLSEHAMKTLIGPHPENLTLDLPCRAVFAAGQREIEVIGPLLEAEAAAVHEGAWG
jgi:tRNA(Arg) A34 adenosine deaminase TadA